MNMKDNFDSLSFAKSIQERRKFKKLGVREAAKEIGISAATLSRVENQRLPELVTYNAICNWLSLDMNYFFDNK
jgi:transcriptional regulator with XRE-family HTH domain